MIGQAPKIVLIDDKRHHLHALAHALGKLDSACLPFHFVDQGPTKHQLRNARVIFCDLHLLSDAVTADSKRQLSLIASMLSEGLGEQHGPFILVIWTEAPESVNELADYLKELEPSQQPIECLCFSKTDFINPKDGELIEEANLIAKIRETLEKWSGVTALLWWEAAVSDAASELAATLWDRSGGDLTERPESLRQTLGKLAIGAAGKGHAKANPGMSVNEALVHMLADRIERTEFPAKIWAPALEFDSQNLAVPASKLNSLVHLDFLHGLSPNNRGSATILPCTDPRGDWFKEKFGCSDEQILEAFVLIVAGK